MFEPFEQFKPKIKEEVSLRCQIPQSLMKLGSRVEDRNPAPTQLNRKAAA